MLDEARHPIHAERLSAPRRLARPGRPDDPRFCSRRASISSTRSACWPSTCRSTTRSSTACRWLRPGGRFAFTTVHPDRRRCRARRSAGWPVGRCRCCRRHDRPLASTGWWAAACMATSVGSPRAGGRLRRSNRSSASSPTSICTAAAWRRKAGVSAFTKHAACCVIGGLGFIGVNLTARLIAEGARVDGADAVARTSRRAGRRLRAPRRADRRRRSARSRADGRASSPAGHGLQPLGAVGRGAQHGGSVDGSRHQPARQSGAARIAARRQSAARSWCSPARDCNTASAESHPRCAKMRAAIRCACTRIHKRTVEEYLQLYAPLFGLRYAIARITNPYGPGPAVRPHGVRRDQPPDPSRPRRSRR